jgi:hypothetical protein
VAFSAGFALQNILFWLGAKLTTGMWTHASFANLLDLLGSMRTGPR